MRHDPNLKGLEFEKSTYNKLKSMLETSEVRNVTMISGFKDEIPNTGKEFEIDFLIVSASCKTIFQIELKKRLNEQAQKKVKEQFKRGMDYFDNLLFERAWCYRTIISTETGPQACSRCKKNVTNRQTSVEDWKRLLDIHSGDKIRGVPKGRLTLSKSFIYKHKIFIPTPL